MTRSLPVTLRVRRPLVPLLITPVPVLDPVGDYIASLASDACAYHNIRLAAHRRRFERQLARHPVRYP